MACFTQHNKAFFIMNISYRFHCTYINCIYMHTETTAFHVPISTKHTDVLQHYLQTSCIQFWTKLENKCGMYGLNELYAHMYVSSFNTPIFIKLTITKYNFVNI